MRTGTDARTIALAGNWARVRGKSFTSGLLFGLSTASLFLVGDLPKPKAPKEDMTSDWVAVGDDLRAAMSRHGG